jgi:hypothetical protein
MMLSVLRRGGRLAALVGVLILGMTACGTERATTPGAQPTSTASPRPTTSPISAPIELRRVGGVAGFHDVLTVHPDGTATLASRARDESRCTINPATKRALDAAVAAASSAPKPTMASPTKSWETSTPDQLHYYLVIDGQRISSAEVTDADRDYRELFTLMNDILTAAAKTRAGEGDPNSACTG